MLIKLTFKLQKVNCIAKQIINSTQRHAQTCQPQFKIAGNTHNVLNCWGWHTFSFLQILFALRCSVWVAASIEKIRRHKNLYSKKSIYKTLGICLTFCRYQNVCILKCESFWRYLKKFRHVETMLSLQFQPLNISLHFPASYLFNVSLIRCSKICPAI